MDKQLLQYFSGELSSDKHSELFRRIERENQLKADYVRLQNLNAVSDLQYRPEDGIEGRESYRKFSRKVKHKVHLTLTFQILKYAAIATILITSSVLATLFLQDSEVGTEFNRLYVPAGQRAKITLQDGTEVWLNAQSILTYPSQYTNKKREVKIVGEAFFNVAKDTKRPFVVTAGDIDLQVLGTQFNVYAYPDANYIQTDLVEGSVRIINRNDEKKTVLLSKNEQMIFKENKMTVNPIKNADHLLWRDGIYSFDNEFLKNIINKLQLYYDVEIIVEDPEIFNVRYTGKFRQRDGIDEILRILQKIQPFKIERDTEKNTITLRN